MEIPVSFSYRSYIPGVVSLGFTLNADWPNELADKPGDIVGRNVEQGGRYFVVTNYEPIGFGVYHYTVVPADG